MSESKINLKQPFSIPPSVIKEILKLGVAYLVIALVAYVLFGERNACNKQLILMYEKNQKELLESKAQDREDKKEMLKIIESHTKAVQSFSEILTSKK